MKIKVLRFKDEGSYFPSESEIEKVVNDFIKDKDVIDIKVNIGSQSVSCASQYYNRIAGDICVYYTIMYNEAKEKNEERL